MAERTPEVAIEAIAEAIPHRVWLADPTGAIDYLNDEAVQYLGMPPEAGYGSKWTALVHPDDVDRTLTGWQHATRTGTPFDLTYRIRRGDGEFRWHAGRGRPVRSDDGDVVRWIGTAEEVAAPPVPGTGDLSPRELVVARLVADGHTNNEIAEHLGLSLRSIEASRARLRRHLGSSSRASIVRFGRQLGGGEPG